MYYYLILSNNITGDNMINNIMSKDIIFGDEKSSISEIAKLMKIHNIGFIPIKSKKSIIGVITDRDICLACESINTTKSPVLPFITKNIICVDINESISSALKLMSKYKIKRLLVKKKDNIVGILSLSDILSYDISSELVNTYKSIFYIHNNEKAENVEIDSFYL